MNVQDKRKTSLPGAPRYLIFPALPAEASTVGPVHILNLSSGGARLEHARPIAPGASLRLHADLPDGHSALDLEGEVRWTLLASRSVDGLDRQYVSGIELRNDPARVQSAVESLRSMGRAVFLDQLRKTTRYELTPPLPGRSPLAGDFQAVDASGWGIRIDATRHPRLGTDSSFSIDNPVAGGSIFLFGTVVWSQAVKPEYLGGAMRYAAGIRFRQKSTELQELAADLCTRGFARLDVDSPQRQMEKMRQRTIGRLRRTTAIRPPDEIPDDQLLMIRHVRDRLASNPDEALQWYNRARFVASEPGVQQILESDTPYRREILAIWEYLERTVPLATIVATFRRKR